MLTNTKFCSSFWDRPTATLPLGNPPLPLIYEEADIDWTRGGVPNLANAQAAFVMAQFGAFFPTRIVFLVKYTRPEAIGTNLDVFCST
jgi:hypothetical protein